MIDNKNYFLSRYTIASLIPNTDYVLLLHGLSGAVILISSNVWESIDKNQINNVSDTVRNELIEGMFLTPLNPEDEEKLARSTAADLHKIARDRHPGTFLFIPTYLCNFRCPYCFQDHALHGGKKDEHTLVMSHEQVDNAYKVIQSFRDKHPNTHYNHVLFGGEPLQMRTRNIVEYLLNKTQEFGDSLSAISNGYELDLFRDLLGPQGIRWIQITVDGDENSHNSRRFAVGRTPTYRKILSNIELAVEKEVQVYVRVNVDASNADSLQGLINEIEELKRSSGSRGLSLGLSVVHGQNIKSLNKITISDSVSRFGDLTSYYQNALRLLSKLMESETHPFQVVSNCSSQMGTYVFDPRDDVYACYEQAGTLSDRVGTYTKGILELDNIKMDQWFGRHPGSIDDCGTCKYIFICSGGCAHFAKQQADTMYASHCEGMKEYMPKVLGEAYLKLLDSSKKSCSKESFAEVAEIY